MSEYEFEPLEDGSIPCGNCGKPIPPFTQVSVIIGGEKPVICHSSPDCSVAGNSRYGYWGDGKLESVFGDIEQC